MQASIGKLKPGAGKRTPLSLEGVPPRWKAALRLVRSASQLSGAHPFKKRQEPLEDDAQEDRGPHAPRPSASQISAFSFSGREEENSSFYVVVVGLAFEHMGETPCEQIASKSHKIWVCVLRKSFWMKPLEKSA